MKTLLVIVVAMSWHVGAYADSPLGMGTECPRVKDFLDRCPTPNVDLPREKSLSVSLDRLQPLDARIDAAMLVFRPSSDEERSRILAAILDTTDDEHIRTLLVYRFWVDLTHADSRDKATGYLFSIVDSVKCCATARTCAGAGLMLSGEAENAMRRRLSVMVAGGGDEFEFGIELLKWGIADKCLSRDNCVQDLLRLFPTVTDHEKRTEYARIIYQCKSTDHVPVEESHKCEGIHKQTLRDLDAYCEQVLCDPLATNEMRLEACLFIDVTSMSRVPDVVERCKCLLDRMKDDKAVMDACRSIIETSEEWESKTNKDAIRGPMIEKE